MIIIADSGATKTAWRSVDCSGTVRAVQTAGMNPSCMDPDSLMAVVRQAVPLLNPEGVQVSSVFFYGAGLISEYASSYIREAMEMWCPFAEISFFSDMMAAARALFGSESGVVAIMGTGSNSCMYSDGEITRNIRPGGFILGDEGSGAALGKAFIADFVKGLLPEHISEEFVSTYGLDYPALVQKVYREPGASAFLASFAPFILERMSDPYVKSLVDECLESFIKRSLVRYDCRKIGVVGSFGCACEGCLRTLGAEYGLEFVRFMKNPVDALVEYHVKL